MKRVRKSFFTFLMILWPAISLSAQDVTITGVTSTPVSCGGASDGTITVTITGGVGLYVYQLVQEGLFAETSPPIPDQNYTFTGHDKYGSYIIIVRDSDPTTGHGFSFASIGGPEPISITSYITTDISCNGTDNGTITVTATGETGNYLFELDGPVVQANGTGVFTGLPLGDYTVTVSDQGGCPSSDVTPVLTIGNPSPIFINIDNVTDIDCYGDSTGSIAITPSGGTPGGGGTGYTYAWTGPGGFSSIQEDLINVPAGNYFVTVYDGNGCEANEGPITVDQQSQITMAVDSIRDVSCFGSSDGAIYVTTGGGSPGYLFGWTGPGTFSASTEDISLLSPGDYQLTVEDALGCIQEMAPQTVSEPLLLTASETHTNIDCYGASDGSIDLTVSGGTLPYSFAWAGPGGFTATTEDISGLGPGTYSVMITDNNGCMLDMPDLVTIQEADELVVTSVKTDITCYGQNDGTISITLTGGTIPYQFGWSGPGGYTSNQEDISGLAAGSYTLTVTDANGCVTVITDIETINEPFPITATLVSQQDVLCNGESTGSIQIDVAGGILPLGFDWENSSGITVSTAEDPSGLPAGTYTLTITDGNGCPVVYPDWVTISQLPPVSSTLAGTDVSCFGGNDGTITVTSTGGTSPYEYSMAGDTGPFQQGNSFTSLSQGTHIVWTRDVNLCVVSDTMTINEPAEIQILGETKSGAILCFGDSTAQISIDGVSGGTPPYEYSINGGVDFYSGNVFSNLPAGTYQTVVRDAAGCTVSGASHDITQPPLLRIGSYLQDDVTTCSDAEEGRIQVTAAGGTGIITYTLDGTTSNTTGDFPDLPGGPHLITLEDENGCTMDTSVVILAPNPLEVTSLTLTHITGCFGDNNGSVDIKASGGTPPLRYSLDGGPPNGSGNFNNILAGDHTVTVTDNNGCILDTVITLTEPAPISIISETVTPVTCPGGADGTIVIEATGGTPLLVFTLNPGSVPSSDGTYGGLSAGIYTVSVDDAEGCGPVNTSPLTVTAPPPFSLDSVVTGDLSCNGAADGTIGIYASGATAPYEYSVDDGSNWSPDSLFGGLASGTYEVWVRDARLCTFYAGLYAISEPPAFNLSITVTDVTTCSGDSTGSLEVLGSGGTGSLEYSLDGIQFTSSGTFGNLPAGPYTVYVRDGAGCTGSEPATIGEPSPLFASIVKNDADSILLGSINFASTTGGTPPYEYTIGGDTGTFSSQTLYTDLDVGSYHAIVRDLNGCTYQEMIEIFDASKLNILVEVTPVSCFGADDGTITFTALNPVGTVEYSLDSGMNYLPDTLFTGLEGNITYHLMARDEGDNLFAASVFISQPSEILLSSSIAPAQCNAFSATGSINITVTGGAGGFTYLWGDGSTEEDRSGLVGGLYILETTDADGCVRVDSIMVNSLVVVLADAGADTTICFGESLQLNGQGAHTPAWDPSPFLSDTTILNPLALEITDSVTFVLTISEEVTPYRCYNRDSVTVTLHPVVGIDAGKDTSVVRGSSIQLYAEGDPFSLYDWQPATWLDNNAVPDPVASPMEPITYYVYATSEYGCTETDSVFVDVIIEELMIYNVFTPNGDGTNDYFEIEGADRFPDMLVEVYSRWGDLLFSTVGYDSGSRWDGTARGKPVPVGTYYYIIITENGAKPITGNVTIIR